VTGLPPDGDDYWMFYDHQTGRWCVYTEPPEVVRMGAEVIHTRTVKKTTASPAALPVEHPDLVLRYRSTGRAKVEVIHRQHDLGGTSYETVAWGDYDQIVEHYPNTRFLYSSELYEAQKAAGAL
jgi:hypothetical protein